MQIRRESGAPTGPPYVGIDELVFNDLSGNARGAGAIDFQGTRARDDAGRFWGAVGDPERALDQVRALVKENAEQVNVLMVEMATTNVRLQALIERMDREGR